GRRTAFAGGSADSPGRAPAPVATAATTPVARGARPGRRPPPRGPAAPRPMLPPPTTSDDRSRARPQSPPADGRRPDERSVLAEPDGQDAGPSREVQAGAGVELGLGGGEERLAESEGHRAPDDRQPEVEEVGDRRHRPPHEHAGASHRRRVGLGRRTTGNGGDGRTRRLSLKTATRATHTQTAFRLDDDVADVAGVAGSPVEETAVEHDAAPDSC